MRTRAARLPAQEERDLMMRNRLGAAVISLGRPIVLFLALSAVPAPAQPPAAPAAGEAPPSTAEIMDTFTKASTGNVADAVDEATGVRGFMGRDMKPVFKAKMIGPVVTVLMQRALRTDKRDWPNLQIQTLDEAPAGSVIVEVLEDGLDTAGVGNLMATTAKVRGLAGMVIDGGARDIEELEEIGFPVWSRSQVPATSVGRYVPVARNVPVTCGGVAVRPGDWIVGDMTGVVVVPKAALPQVLKLLRQYDDKETKMIPLIKETKSMGKALQIYNRY
jgi:regulator of RNase E activity RraA